MRLCAATRRAEILSFNVEGLHHELVAMLLDHRRFIHDGLAGIKPGWVRVSFRYVEATGR